MTNVMNKEKEVEPMFTNLKVALEWLNIDMVLMNKIPELDEDLLWTNPISGVWNNPEYDAEKDDTDEAYIDEAPDSWEIYQYYATNANAKDVEWLEENVPSLHFVYSDVLDCYVFLCDCCGTSWDYVSVETKCPEMVRALGEGKIK